MRKLVAALLRPFVLPIVEEVMSRQREQYRELERTMAFLGIDYPFPTSEPPSTALKSRSLDSRSSTCDKAD